MLVAVFVSSQSEWLVGESSTELVKLGAEQGTSSLLQCLSPVPFNIFPLTT